MSSVYQLGTAVGIRETFEVDGTPTDPTTVVFTTQDPLGVEVSYTAGVDAEVTNPSVGVYVLKTPPVAVAGTWRWEVVGTGDVATSGGGSFLVAQPSLNPSQQPYPQFGPCSQWIDCDDVSASCDVAEADIPMLDAVALAASQVMFEISGRQFTGRCEHTVRPCGLDVTNPCWLAAPWNGWTGWPWAWTWDGVAWGWYDGLGVCHCGCEAIPRVKLAGYPVTEITEVKIDGVVLAANRAGTGGPNYRLDKNQFLTRMRDQDDPHIPVYWPACQDLTLNDDQAGTWSVTYMSGIEPPEAGKMAAAALACELLPGTECKLPSGARRIVRQGITIDRIQPLAQMLLEGSTGIVAIDAFLAAYNPSKLRRRPVIWSPDGPTYAQRMGN
jgi:hypothetical protein